MIVVRLREAMKAYAKASGEKMTYSLLSERTGLAKATLASLASRQSYNATLSTIEKVCRALRCTPGDILEIVEDAGDEDQQKNGN